MKTSPAVFFLAFVVFGLASGCNYNRVKETPKTSTNDAMKMLGNLDYAIVQGAVLGPKCISCHSTAGGNQGGVNMESYQNVRPLLARVAFRTLEKMDMPPRQPLTPDEMIILRNWLEMGAPERIADVREKPDPSLESGPTDWQKINQKIFANKCLDCHSQPNAEANLDLNSYNEVKAKASLIFDRIFVRQDMPIEPYPALSPRERKVLLNWFNMGMPN